MTLNTNKYVILSTNERNAKKYISAKMHEQEKKKASPHNIGQHENSLVWLKTIRLFVWTNVESPKENK